MKKKLLILLALIGIVLLIIGIPVVNLFVKPPAGTALTDAKQDDPLFTKAAEGLQAKCGSCHLRGVALPFYAKFPVARGIIRKDIDAGLVSFNFVAELVPSVGPASEPALAKLEFVIEHGTMPPGRYLALHWDGDLGAAEKEAVLGWIKSVRRAHYATPGFEDAVQEGAIRPLPKTVQADPARVALGKRLYHDKRLSGDDTVSCATCHDLARGGTDRAPFSTGIGGKQGDINAPTTFNACFQFVQFWDGRAATLEAQAGGPVTNPVEMGGEWLKVLAKLKADAAFAKAFTAAYPSGLTPENIQHAIAEFERTLVTPDSKFDKFLAGDVQALSADEQKGYDLFRKHACATCHVGKLVGGCSYEKMGMMHDYFAERGGKAGKADNGRFNETKKEPDRRRFKVPTLRNIAQTGPYFHDGGTADLKKAVTTMAWVQRGVDLSEADAGLIVKFLGTLTGTYEGKPVQ